MFLFLFGIWLILAGLVVMRVVPQELLIGRTIPEIVVGSFLIVFGMWMVIPAKWKR